MFNEVCDDCSKQDETVKDLGYDPVKRKMSASQANSLLVEIIELQYGGLNGLAQSAIAGSKIAKKLVKLRDHTCQEMLNELE